MKDEKEAAPSCIVRRKAGADDQSRAIENSGQSAASFI